MLNIANIITASRILWGIGLLFFPTFSIEFYVLYLLGGFSDMVDGTIARKRNEQSAFGARLDTTADFIFVVAACYKVLPKLPLDRWLVIWVIVIALIKIGNMLTGYFLQKRLVVEHTIANKVTGGLLFLIPLGIEIVEKNVQAVLLGSICVVATFAAIQEGYYICLKREKM